MVAFFYRINQKFGVMSSSAIQACANGTCDAGSACLFRGVAAIWLTKDTAHSETTRQKERSGVVRSATKKNTVITERNHVEKD